MPQLLCWFTQKSLFFNVLVQRFFNPPTKWFLWDDRDALYQTGWSSVDCSSGKLIYEKCFVNNNKTGEEMLRQLLWTVIPTRGHLLSKAIDIQIADIFTHVSITEQSASLCFNATWSRETCTRHHRTNGPQTIHATCRLKHHFRQYFT